MNSKVMGGAMALTAGATIALALPAGANAADLFGAMAYSPSTGAFAWATGPTRQAAEDAAYTKCSATDNAWDCAVGYTQSGAPQSGCMAIVSRGAEWGMGADATKDAATAAANQQMGGAPGLVVAAQCIQGS